jgi:hypothetical protein
VLVVVLGVLTGAGCTLLARFDDVTTGFSCDAGACGDAEPLDARLLPAPDAPPDAIPHDASTAPDTSTAPDAGDPCLGLASGMYCGEDGLKGYVGPPGDLVACDGGGVARVVACDAGCLSMPNPFPDTCNECNGKPNGGYCGRDFPGFPARDADFFIQCQQGNAVQVVACAHGCGSNGAASACN